MDNRTVCGLAALLAAACAAEGENIALDATVGIDAAIDASSERVIPDPGTTVLGAQWLTRGIATGHCSPETAYPLGVASRSPDYFDSDLCPSGDAFFVFRSGPTLNSITLFAAGPADVDELHLHRGEGLVFGTEVIPQTIDYTPINGLGVEGTWELQPDSVYVIHVKAKESSFF